MSLVLEGGLQIDYLTRGAGIDTRVAVRCATTDSVVIGNLISGNLVDSILVTDGDRVLVKNQSTQAQVTTVTTVADIAGSLSAQYFLINSTDKGYYVWFNMDNLSTDPGSSSVQLRNSGRTGIQVNYSAGALANDIAAALTTAINNGSYEFTAVNTGAPSSTVTITNNQAGYVPNATDGPTGYDTGFGFSITSGGASNVDHGIWVVDPVPYRSEDMLAGDNISHVFVHVEEGNANKHTIWACKNSSGSDTVGTNLLEWAQFSSYNYLKGDIFVAGSENNLVKVPQPSQISLLQNDSNGNVVWTPKADVQAGLDPKESVRFATLSALTGGVVAYLIGSVNAPTGEFVNVDLTPTGSLDLNGNSVVVGDRVLVKNQADPKQNGIYTVLTTGLLGSLGRAGDQDGANPPSNLSSGNFTFVELGSTLGQTGWITQGDGALAVNTDPISWVQFNGSFGISSGKGITVASNKVSLNPDTLTLGTTIAGVASTLDAAVASVVSSSTLDQLIVSTGVAGNAASWGTVNLASSNAVGVSVLPVVNGGTGLNTYTQGDTLYYDVVGASVELQKLAAPVVPSTLVYATGGPFLAQERPSWTTSPYASSLLSSVNKETQVEFSAPLNAVNWLTLSSNTTGNSPTVTTTGTDTNINLNLQTKGTGVYNLLSTSTAPTNLKWYEQTTNGANSVSLKSPASLSSDIAWTLPPGPANNGYILQTDASGNWSFVNPQATTKRGYTIQSTEISVNNCSPTFNVIGYFAWQNSEYLNASNVRLVFYTLNTSGGAGNRNIVLTVKNAAGGTIGGPTTFNTNGIQTLTFVKPAANDYLTIQVQKSANGGINPVIRGLQLELN